MPELSPGERKPFFAPAWRLSPADFGSSDATSRSAAPLFLAKKRPVSETLGLLPTIPLQPPAQILPECSGMEMI